MEYVNLNFNTIFLLGYVDCKVPEEVMEAIKEEVYEIKEKNFQDAIPYNYLLAGSIEKEFQLVKPKTLNLVNDFTSTVAKQYFRFWNDIENSNKNYYIRNRDNEDKTSSNKKDLWVNFQRKHEFNPLHTHGGHLSFVIWVQVPYDIEEEKKLPQFVKQNAKEYCNFKFRYPNFLWRGGVSAAQIDVNKEMEGTMIMFPSWLLHEVTPFYTSDDYRISVSGNLDPEELIL